MKFHHKVLMITLILFTGAHFLLGDYIETSNLSALSVVIALVFIMFNGKKEISREVIDSIKLIPTSDPKFKKIDDRNIEELVIKTNQWECYGIVELKNTLPISVYIYTNELHVLYITAVNLKHKYSLSTLFDNGLSIETTTNIQYASFDDNKIVIRWKNQDLVKMYEFHLRKVIEIEQLYSIRAKKQIVGDEFIATMVSESKKYLQFYNELGLIDKIRLLLGMYKNDKTIVP